MGIWVELGIFGVALALGLWQIHDVRQERRKREAQKSTAEPPQAEKPAMRASERSE
jgi:hypothetical protein